MDAAFALIVDKHAASRGRSWGFPSPSVDDLGLQPSARLDWSDASGRVRLTAWQQTTGPAAHAWHDDGGAVAAVAGSIRWRGRGWEPGERGATALADAAAVRTAEEIQDDLRGVFAAVHLTDAGDGWVLTDLLGLRLLYWGETDDVVVVASRAALAAHAIAHDERPQRSGLSGAWLAFSGFRLGDGTGYADVRVAAPGARFLIDAGSPRWDDPDPLVVSPTDELWSLSLEDRTDLVEADVAESLRAALECPAERHLVRLTGGKDSRLVLAVALRAGIADEFVYETVGPPELADVQIAAELCEALGLRHEVRFLDMVQDVPFARRFDSFVRATACMVNGWDLATYAPRRRFASPAWVASCSGGTGRSPRTSGPTTGWRRCSLAPRSVGWTWFGAIWATRCSTSTSGGWPRIRVWPTTRSHGSRSSSPAPECGSPGWGRARSWPERTR